MLRVNALGQFPQAPEIVAVRLDIFCDGGRCHESPEPQMGQGPHGLGGRRRCFFREAPFRFLTGDVDFHQHVDDAVVPGCFLFNLFRQAQRVHGMDEAHLVNDVFHFVALQMADHMPLRGLAQDLVLLLQLLHVVFAERLLPFRQQDPDILNGFGLAHRQQRHAGRIPAGPFTGRADPRAYVRQILFQLFCCKFQCIQPPLRALPVSTSFSPPCFSRGRFLFLLLL